MLRFHVFVGFMLRFDSVRLPWLVERGGSDLAGLGYVIDFIIVEIKLTAAVGGCTDRIACTAPNTRLVVRPPKDREADRSALEPLVQNSLVGPAV